MKKPAPSLSSRRKFLKTTALTGAVGAFAANQSFAMASAPVQGKSKPAKNLIFLVVDGMCHGTLGLAHHWSLRNRGEPLNWMQLYNRPDLNQAKQDTASASSPVTDSAAASSAWGSGVRVNNGAINMTAEGKALKPIMSYAKEAGKATGLVTTCRVTHATPAGFTANVAKRGEEGTIARQYLDRDVDVILGGGTKIFKDDTVNLLPDFEAAGYTVCTDRSSLRASAGAPKLLGLFSKSHIPYALDRKNDKSLSEVPDLRTLFETALDSLSRSNNGFALQVEGGRVDHAGHANDAAGILHELLEFDQCIPIALKFLEENPDTLLIVSTDHGTGGCQLDGFGKRYNGSGPALDRINQFKYTFEWLEKRFRKSGKFDATLFKQVTGIVSTEAQVAAMQAAIADPETTYLTSAISDVFKEEFTKISATGWSSNKHNSENVDLLAFGPGSEAVGGYVRNNEVCNVMTSALALI